MLMFIGFVGEIWEVPISPPLLNKTKPLKWLNISGAFSWASINAPPIYPQADTTRLRPLSLAR